MVIDFGELKRIVNEQIVDRLDHALVVRVGDPIVQCGCDNVIICDYQPTCENMLVEFAQRISSQLPPIECFTALSKTT